MYIRPLLTMPVPNGKVETNNHKKQKRWSLVGILSKKKKIKKSQESVDFCPYDGKINQKVAQKNDLERPTDCLIQQYTCSPRQIRRCNSLQYTGKASAYSNITSRPTFDEWQSSQQSICSSSSSACYSDIGVYRNFGFSHNQPSYYTKEKNNEQSSPILQNVPFRCSSEIGDYQNKTFYNQRYYKPLAANQKRIIGKKIPPPPPPRDPNVKAVYYFRNNRLVSRDSDSTYFSQGSDDNIPEKVVENEMKCESEYYVEEPPRSRRPIQICDVETLSTESENSVPRTQSVEEALQELEDIYNSLGLSDEDLLDRAERRDLPTQHQNMRYESSDELDCVNFKRVLPKTRRSGVPDIVSDDMAYRRLNRKESKRSSFVPGSFLLVLPTVYNLDKTIKPSGEPDITLDDVVFRSRRQHLNFLKIADPQPPFGIPVGPIVGAAPSDYLHAVPEGRYKPSFHPRKVPDTVEDDLAFRSLRKDNRYKACVDFSSVRKDRSNVARLMPGTFNGRIKNDAHWIVEKTASAANRSAANKKRVRLVWDDAAATRGDDRQNLMVVKINHHKPIMLTGFTLNEASQLSESFFRTKLLQHEPRSRIRLTNSCTYYAAAAPNGSSKTQLLISKRPLNASTAPAAVTRRRRSERAASDGRAPEETGKRDSDENYAARTLVKFAGPTTTKTKTTTTTLGCDKSQPNFRELILREYHNSHNNRLRSCDQSDAANSFADVTGRRFACDTKIVVAAAAAAVGSCAVPKTERPDRTTGNVTEDCAADGLGESSSETRRPSPRRNGHSSSSSTSSSTSSQPSAEYRMPGFLEVCLCSTIYIYHLFSANAYSTFIALIFLVALHVCRRLS